ncbi:hypothetical protein BIW11_12641 [Tropilaelaps mercedesae]|uniref:Uncharacterized protein n=1 Tax=Tropilaelaps mercedesae TaxID=418985 RepID=A0A1V9X649_9ACAR|nr:hypothetical protein BIW11_12641 [Tropilaelaps mercedesae]
MLVAHLSQVSFGTKVMQRSYQSHLRTGYATLGATVRLYFDLSRTTKNFRLEVHFTTYRCVAHNEHGVLGSRDVRIEAGKGNSYAIKAFLYSSIFVLSGILSSLY